MTWWLIGFILWVLAGLPVSIMLGPLYGKQWDGKIYGYLLVLSVLVSLPFLVLSWCYIMMRYGKVQP
jgi:hypothetical protein